MTQQLTVQQHEYGPLLRFINFLATGLEALPLGLGGELDADGILHAARRRAGLEHFGDNYFQGPLKQILRHANAAGFTALGRVSAQQSLIHAASNRLYIEQHLNNYPRIRNTPIRRPIFILGFPRTGTTLLQNLLALNPRRRALQMWELNRPVPVHPDPDEDARLRLRSADRVLSFAYLLAPEMRYIHEIKSTTYEECWPLFFNTFMVMNYDFQASLKGFGDWLMTRDMTPAYQDYRTQLQILQQRAPDADLVLKCPEHLWFVDALLAVFPDACIVWTHRDPLASIASYCSLISIQHRMLFGGFDPHKLGTHITDRFHHGVTRAMASRDRHDRPEQFIDVDFKALVDDPVKSLREIYAHFEMDFPDNMNAQVTQWLSTARADKRGRHHYSAERYGLDTEAIDAQYADYIERFSIPLAR
ncbi:MAG: sulfotransferase [Myxococcota bacterium]